MSLVSASDYFVPQCVPSVTHKKNPLLFRQNFVVSYTNPPNLNFSSSSRTRRISHKVKFSICRDMNRSYKAGNYDESLLFLERLVGGGTFKPKVRFCLKLIKRFVYSKRIEKAVKVMEILEPYGEPDVYAYRSIIHGYSKLNQIGSAMQVFNRMRNRGFVPTLKCYNSLLNLLLKSRKRNDAEKLLKDMSLANCEPNEATFRILIHSLCRDDKMDEAIQAFNHMRNRGFVPDVFCYNSLLNLLLKSGKRNDAEELLKDMSSTNCEPDEGTFSILMDEALDLLMLAMEKGVKPDTFLMTPLISAWCKRGRLDVAVECIDHMILHGCLPYATVVGDLLCSLWEDGTAEQVVYLFEKLRDAGYHFDVVTYNIMIKGLWRNGDMIKAVRLVTEMIDRGINPDNLTYTKLIACLCRDGFVDQAITLLGVMENNGIKPRVKDYNVVLKGLSIANRLDEAMELLEEMVLENSYLPNDYTYNTLIVGIGLTGMGEEATELANSLIQMGVIKTNPFRI